MEIYIKGKGIIAPNHISDETATQVSTNKMNCIEPNYLDFFDSRALRRMSRIVKLGSTAATIALKDANLETPDSIIVGTGFGCLEDTSIFLRKMVVNKEETLNPTPFIFSTHNSISSQIAIKLKVHGYNSTYSHRNFSFESALLDAYLLLKENESKNIIVGGIDELTDDSFTILKQLDYYKNEIAGEGSSFFILSNEADKNCVAELKSIQIYSNVSVHVALAKAKNILEENKIDAIIIGSREHQHHPNDQSIIKALKAENKVIYYKHLSGEYPTASAFAFGLATTILKNNAIKNLLIYNHYADTNHSFILLSAC